MILLRVLAQTVFLAIGQIWANKLRALLTALGIIIGVASVIVVIGSLTGLRGFVLSEVETFGARKMWIWGNVPREKRATMRWSDAMISVHEARELLEHAEAIDKLTVMTRARYDCVHRGKSQKGMRVSGIWPEWHEIEDRSVERGRQFIRSDEEERQHVCLVNDMAIEELELGSNPLGKYIL
ncbi:MAG: ABC transporter permease, partial [Phycisphaerales bacterium]|nr:ABC transporter permease [Phycisphaerales bacterium]